jgi:hypothetical protein
LLAENRSDFREMGMNTFGILSDRVTILSCKARLSIDPDARDAAKKQVRDVINALQECGVGDPNLLSKEQVISTGSGFFSAGDAFHHLLRSNIGMWINQDLLYTKSVDDVSDSRLRSYIKFFSKENTVRNRAISFLDDWFNRGKSNA